eukprot:jgi/Mesvir1/28995/Mv17765-RA.2
MPGLTSARHPFIPEDDTAPPPSDLRQLLVMSFAFLTLFSAYNALQAYVTTVLPGDLGDESLLVVYCTQSATVFAAPSIVARIGEERAMVVGGLSYVFYMITLIKVYVPLVIFASSVVGFGAGLLWVAQGIFLTKCSPTDQRGLYTGIFWGIFFCCNIFGNVASFFVFKILPVYDLFTMFTFQSAAGVCLLYQLVPRKGLTSRHHMQAGKQLEHGHPSPMHAHPHHSHAQAVPLPVSHKPGVAGAPPRPYPPYMMSPASLKGAFPSSMPTRHGLPMMIGGSIGAGGGSLGPMGSLGAGSMGAGSMGAGSMGAGSMGAGSMGAGSMGAGSLGAMGSLGAVGSMGSTAMGSAMAPRMPFLREAAEEGESGSSDSDSDSSGSSYYSDAGDGSQLSARTRTSTRSSGTSDVESENEELAPRSRDTLVLYAMLAPSAFFVGLELAFWTGEFPKLLPATTIGLVAGAMVLSWLSDKIGYRYPTFVVGVLHYLSALYVTFILFCELRAGEQDKGPQLWGAPIWAYLAGLCFGVGDGVFNSHMYSMLGRLFAEDDLEAWTLYNLLVNGGLAIGYGYALILPLVDKDGNTASLAQVYTQGVLVTLSMVLYVTTDLKYGSAEMPFRRIPSSLWIGIETPGGTPRGPTPRHSFTTPPKAVPGKRRPSHGAPSPVSSFVPSYQPSLGRPPRPQSVARDGTGPLRRSQPANVVRPPFQPLPRTNIFGDVPISI